MQITRRTVLGLGACLALSGWAQADTVNWDMPNEYGASSIPAEADRMFAARVNEKSGGKIVITNHFGGALGYKSRDHWSAVEDGAVPIASTYTGVFAGIDPIFQLQSLPSWPPIPGVEGAAGRHAPLARGRVRQGRTEVPAGCAVDPGRLWAQKKITDAEGLKNLKIRSYDKTGTLTLKNAGAAAIQLSWPTWSRRSRPAPSRRCSLGRGWPVGKVLRVHGSLPPCRLHHGDEHDPHESGGIRRPVSEPPAGGTRRGGGGRGRAWANINDRIALNIKRLEENGSPR